MIHMRVRFRKCACIAAMALSLIALTPVVTTAADIDKGPVWRTWGARAVEAKKGDYLRYIVKVYYHKLEAWKQAGLLTDYKVLVTEPRGPNDPDVIFMFQYPNMAALDVSDDVWEEIGTKALEKFKDDKEIQTLNAEYVSWRQFTGWSPTAREVVWEATRPAHSH